MQDLDCMSHTHLPTVCREHGRAAANAEHFGEGVVADAVADFHGQYGSQTRAPASRRRFRRQRRGQIIARLGAFVLLRRPAARQVLGPNPANSARTSQAFGAAETEEAVPDARCVCVTAGSPQVAVVEEPRAAANHAAAAELSNGINADEL